MTYNKIHDETHIKIEPALNIKAMKLYHCHQAAFYMNESRSSITPINERRYKWIRNKLDDSPKPHQVLYSSQRFSKDENWIDEAIELILDKDFINKEIKRLNKQ